MRKVVLILLVLLSSCANRISIEGTVQEKATIEPDFLQKVLSADLKEGDYYLVGDTSKIYLIYTNNQEVIKKGDSGTFILGKIMFKGTSVIYRDGKKVEISNEGRELIEFIRK